MHLPKSKNLFLASAMVYWTTPAFAIPQAATSTDVAATDDILPSSTYAIPPRDSTISDVGSMDDPEKLDNITAANYLAAAGIPLWVESDTDSQAGATDGNGDTYYDHPRNLTARDFGKSYELYCTGANMGGFMRKCGDAPPLTGWLCQANCHCTKAGCIKCEDKELGDCSLGVFQATCRIPNVNFACACRVKGTEHSDGLAQMCNVPTS